MEKIGTIGLQEHVVLLDVRLSAIEARLEPMAINAPYVSQEGAQGELLTSTMGVWRGEPTTYAYQWKRDGTADIGTGSAYTVTTADLGHTITCVVTATNGAGSASSPPSNGIAIPEDFPGAVPARAAPQRK
jgi:hypothetical protein